MRFLPLSSGHPPHVVEHRLPHEPVAAAMARALATDLARDRVSETRVNDLALMVSELVTNAVRHAPPQADGRIGLRLELGEGVLRAVVVDGGPEFGFDPTLDITQRGHHFGLLLVDALADRWGLSLDGKKAVWVEVDVPG